jgi:WD40 repeat protein
VPLTSNWDPDGPWQLATYTADSSGNLTTNSTYSNMPSVSVGGVNDYRMSPSGQYLAVGGTKGFQIFHFNGANPITPFTGLLTSAPITQIFWDNANHVYALSPSAGKVFVFTVTSTGVTRAPGSPHAVPSPQSLIVLPR